MIAIGTAHDQLAIRVIFGVGKSGASAQTLVAQCLASWQRQAPHVRFEPYLIYGVGELARLLDGLGTHEHVDAWFVLPIDRSLNLDSVLERCQAPLVLLQHPQGSRQQYARLIRSARQSGRGALGVALEPDGSLCGTLDGKPEVIRLLWVLRELATQRLLVVGEAPDDDAVRAVRRRFGLRVVAAHANELLETLTRQSAGAAEALYTHWRRAVADADIPGGVRTVGFHLALEQLRDSYGAQALAIDGRLPTVVGLPSSCLDATRWWHARQGLACVPRSSVDLAVSRMLAQGLTRQRGALYHWGSGYPLPSWELPGPPWTAAPAPTQPASHFMLHVAMDELRLDPLQAGGPTLAERWRVVVRGDWDAALSSMAHLVGLRVKRGSPTPVAKPT